MARLFGTDGVRGVANDELTPLLAMQLGQEEPMYYRRRRPTNQRLWSVVIRVFQAICWRMH